MKEYLVQAEWAYYIVLAKDAKDAINQIYEKYSDWYDKRRIYAQSLGSLHNEKGKIIRVD